MINTIIDLSPRFKTGLWGHLPSSQCPVCFLSIKGNTAFLHWAAQELAMQRSLSYRCLWVPNVNHEHPNLQQDTGKSDQNPRAHTALQTRPCSLHLLSWALMDWEQIWNIVSDCQCAVVWAGSVVSGANVRWLYLPKNPTQGRKKYGEVYN